MVKEGFVEALDSLQDLDRIPRLGYLTRGVADPESVAEHSYHVAFLVWALGPSVPGLDLARAVGLALLHDVGELATGDIPRTAADLFPLGAKKAAERRAAERLLAPLGEDVLEAVAEALGGDTLEARFVKACDVLQLRIKAAHYLAQGAPAVADLADGEEPSAAEEFPAVARLAEALSARRAP